MKRKNFLSRESRQAIAIPVIATAILALIYVIILIDEGTVNLLEPMSLTTKSLPAYVNLLIFSITSWLFIKINNRPRSREDQTESDSFLFGWLVVSAIILLAVTVIHFIFKTPFLELTIIALGVVSGMFYKKLSDPIPVILLISLVLMTFINVLEAFVIVFLINFVALVVIAIRLFIKGRDFRRFVFLIGLGPKESYQKIDSEEEKINLTEPPINIAGFTTVCHNLGPVNFSFEEKKWTLYTSFVQGGEENVKGTLLARDPIIRNRGLNGNLLDWLLKNKEQIPADWEDKTILFWGTIYQQGQMQYVRSLQYKEKKWVSGFYWIAQMTSSQIHSIVLNLP